MQHTCPIFLELSPGEHAEEGVTNIAINVDIIERIFERDGRAYCITRFDDEELELKAQYRLYATALVWPGA